MDFEVSLIHRDEINVGYILRLLAGIQAMPPKEQQEQKKKIMDIVDSDVTLRSKRELIDNFIEKACCMPRMTKISLRCLKLMSNRKR